MHSTAPNTQTCLPSVYCACNTMDGDVSATCCRKPSAGEAERSDMRGFGLPATTNEISSARQVSEVHKQLAASNIDTFLARGRKPSAGEAERSDKRGFAPDYDKGIRSAHGSKPPQEKPGAAASGDSGAAAPNYDKRNQQCATKMRPTKKTYVNLVGYLQYWRVKK